MDDLVFNCPHCKELIQCGEGWRGRKINCPICQRMLIVAKKETLLRERIGLRLAAALVLAIGGLVGYLSVSDSVRPGDQERTYIWISGPHTGQTFKRNDWEDRTIIMFVVSLGLLGGSAYLFGKSNEGLPMKIFEPSKAIRPRTRNIRAIVGFGIFLLTMGLFIFLFAHFQK